MNEPTDIPPAGKWAEMAAWTAARENERKRAQHRTQREQVDADVASLELWLKWVEGGKERERWV